MSSSLRSFFALTHVLPKIYAVASLVAFLPLDELSNIANAVDGIPNSVGLTDVIQAVQDRYGAVESTSISPTADGRRSPPISDSIEAFTLGAQGFFKESGVPYPLGSAIIFTTFTVKALTFPSPRHKLKVR